MAITGKSPEECVRQFRDILSHIVSETLSRQAVMSIMRLGDDFRIAFLQGDEPRGFPIKTSFGPLYFHVGQLVSTEINKQGKHELQTLHYYYRLQTGPRFDDPALLRWEYEKVPRNGALFCRHHIQGNVRLVWGDRNIHFNSVHVPTGWVLIEEVIRFLIHELGHKPPCGNRWNKVLTESRDAFFAKLVRVTKSTATPNPPKRR